MKQKQSSFLPQLILASRSPIRAKILSDAGVTFSVEPADINEIEFLSEKLEGDPDELVLSLSEAKARFITSRYPGACVIGADQILFFEGCIFCKISGPREAHQFLQKVRGKSHSLHSGVVCVRDNNVLWRYADVAHMTMRPFSDSFLYNYISGCSEPYISMLGAYRFEENGIQLFERIEGDYFTILGLPLLPLLNFLRSELILPS